MSIQHAAVISFGLEAHVVRVSRSDFEEIVDPSRDCPGPVKPGRTAAERAEHVAKAAIMRSWKLPLRFNEPGSRDSDKERLFHFPLALICDRDVWLFVDFVRLIQFRITSYMRPFCDEDLKPGSPVSDLIAFLPSSKCISNP